MPTGLKEVGELSWRNKSKVLFHICDAPCHGSRFHNNLNDDHPKGDPQGLQIQDLLKTIVDKNIDYYFTEINSYTEKMIQEFDKELENNGRKITLYKLDRAEDLLDKFTTSVTMTIANTKSMTMSHPGGTSSVLKDKIINKSNLIFEPSKLKEHDAEIITLEFSGDLGTFKELMNQYTKKITPVQKLDSFIKMRRENTKVLLCEQPFSKGNLRFAYTGLVKRGTEFEKVVAKNSLYKDDQKDTYQYNKQAIILQVVAKYLADKFIKDSSSLMSIKFLNVQIMQLLDTGEYFSIEEYLDGKFDKWSNNLGYVNENEYSYTLDAFSHWTWVNTNKYLVVTDLQGLRQEKKEREGTYILTDPAISCVDRQFTSTDLGIFGIDKYFKLHRCNYHCTRDLKLERHPDQQIENRVTVDKATKIK